MSRENKTLLAALTGVAVLVPALLAVGLGWPVWAWLLLTLALLSAPLSLSWYVKYRQQQERLLKQLETQQAPRQEEPTPFHSPLSEVPLPSTDSDYRFVLSCHVYWHPAPGGAGPPHQHLAGLAIDSVITRARRITDNEFPGDYALAAHRLNAILGEPVPDTSGHVRAWATQVSLRLPETDIDRLNKLAEVRKDEEVWEHERNYERNKRAYLREDVLTDPGSATVWWLAQDKLSENDVIRTVGLMDDLARLSAAASNTEVHELYRHLTIDSSEAADSSSPEGQEQPPWHTGPFRNGAVTAGGDGYYQPGFFAYGQAAFTGDPVLDRAIHLIETCHPDNEDPARRLFVERMARLFEAQENSELATKLRDRYNTPSAHTTNGTSAAGPGAQERTDAAPPRNSEEETDRNGQEHDQE